jgi:prophage tail gpP-like protein
MNDDDLSLVAGGLTISGWNSLRVSRGIERCPSDFEFIMTERFPGELKTVVITPGDACQVKLGNDVVITGYVDRFAPSYSAGGAGGQHSIQISGRGKCEDLVDCAAEWPSNQMSGVSALAIAQKLCQPYGITASAIGPMGAAIPQFNIMWGETAFEIIERVCRYRALLAYDGPDGNLILSGVGTQKAACGFKEGVNVQSASIVYSADQRYSQYVVRRLNTDNLAGTGVGGDILQTFADPQITRHRRRYIIAENGDTAGADVALQRGAWEASRRAGRSYQVRLITDNWRDSNGVLWTPNTLVPLELPALHIAQAEWLISEVTYKRDESGTTAELIIMPAPAFNIEPLLLFPSFPDVKPGV